MSHVLDVAKATQLTLSEEEVEGLEKLADSLDLDVIRYWEKVME